MPTQAAGATLRRSLLRNLGMKKCVCLGNQAERGSALAVAIQWRRRAPRIIAEGNDPPRMVPVDRSRLPL
ncbi:MAG: hypothetical protein DYG96_15890 [Chlorobi bacterium CHB2]|nr:hypothetical protein [Chlorobi bacterium CHB2]